MQAFLLLNIIMIRLTENIKNDLARWDKLGYIIISASISTTETMPKLDADGNEIPGGKYHLDLREANMMTLIRAAAYR